MRDATYILGIDQSTQGTKAVIFDCAGRILARADAVHEQIISRQGYVSHDLDEIYDNVLAVSKEAVKRAGIGRQEIACIGIDNQRETTACWNKRTGESLGQAIVWHCNRAKDICDRIGKTENIAEEIYRKTGLMLSPYYPAGKMRWMLENIPEVGDAARDGTLAMGTIDSWLIGRLTEEKAFKTDYSNAGRTQLFHIGELKWDAKLCGIFGIPTEALPQVCDSDVVFGHTTLGGFLDKAIPICGVLGDSNGALFGHNCRKKGEIKATYGTGSSVMMNTGDHPFFSRHGLSTSIAWRIRGKTSYVLEGNINYTGAVISWLKDNLNLIQSPKETAELAKNSDPNDSTYFVPAFSGLGAPWWKNDAQAMLMGMNRNTGKNEIVRAACDCIAYQINDVVEAMRMDTGIAIGDLCVDGGPTGNDYLMQFQSDISRTEIRIPDVEELSVTGAAYLAGTTAGIYDRNKIYEAISYHRYQAQMEAGERTGKLAGWNRAIGMLLKD